MHWYYDDVGWFGWLMMIVLMLVFWGGLLAVVITLTRRYWQPGRHQAGGPDTPENILAARFARGEIDEEEYRRRREALRH